MQQNLDDTAVYVTAASSGKKKSDIPGGHFASSSEQPEEPEGPDEPNEPDEPDEPVAPDEPEGKHKKKHHVGRIVLIILLVLLVIVYGAGAYIFSDFYYPGTVVLDADISLMQVDEAAAAIEESAEDYQLTITSGEFSWTYTPASTDEVVDAESVAQEVLDGNEPLAWPVHLVESLLGQSETLDLFAEATADDLPEAFDQAAFEEELGAAVDEYNETRSGTFDAASAYDESTGTFTVEAARSNQKLIKETVVEDALAQVARLETTLELDDDDFELIADGATDEELQAACDAANTLASTDVDLVMGGTTVATLDASEMLSWITFDESLTPSLDTSQLTTWVANRAESVDTVGAERTFTGSAGDTVTISGGTFGWEIDQETLLTTLQEAVSTGQTGEIEVPTLSEGDVYTAQGEPDWGAYVEVDISEQWAWYYDADGNLLWESGVITGNPNKGNDTPQGVYYVNAMYRDITLTGDYDPETDTYSYESPVSYWMAFVGSSVGFHDATWQSESNFGDPDAYYSVGSHGCVNLSLSSAEELYSVLEVGVCVIVHE